MCSIASFPLTEIPVPIALPSQPLGSALRCHRWDDFVCSFAQFFFDPSKPTFPIQYHHIYPSALIRSLASTRTSSRPARLPPEHVQGQSEFTHQEADAR